MADTATVVPFPDRTIVHRLHVDALKHLVADQAADPAFRAGLVDPEAQIDRALQMMAAAIDPSLTLFLAAIDVMPTLDFERLSAAGAVANGVDHLLYVRDPLMWIRKARREAPERLAAWWALIQETLDPWHRSGIVPCAHASGA